MKIAILDTYSPVVDYKDAGQIIEGLKDLNIEAFFISINSPKLRGHIPPFIVLTGNLMDIDFWEKIDVDVVLFISRLDPRYTKILEIIRNSGKKVIVKADSDGTIGYPLVPNYLRILKPKDDFIQWIFSNVKWRLPIGYFVKRKLKHIELADAVIFETPEAMDNVIKVLDFWNKSNLIKKLFLVPDPVSSDIINTKLEEKTETIISVGRWDDERCKNTTIMLKAMSDFLKNNKNYKYIIVGPGENKIYKFVHKLSPEVSSRITICGPVIHDQIPKLLSKSKIFFAPSNLESFNIAAAEALCLGCSVVGTPLPNFKYLTAGGFSGTLIKGFNKSSCVLALVEDSKKWENSVYSTEKISNFWKEKLERKEIVKKITKIFSK